MRLRDEVRHDARDAVRSDVSALESRRRLREGVRTLWGWTLVICSILLLGAVLDALGVIP